MGIGGFDDRIIPDPNILTDVDSSPPVQPHPPSCRPWGKPGGDLKQSIPSASKKTVFDHELYALEQNRKGYPIVSVSIGRLPLRTAMHLRNMAAKIMGHPAAKSLSPLP